MKSPILLTLVVVAGILVNSSEARLLYSIDRGRDMLIQLDTASTEIIDVGPLGLNVTTVEELSMYPDGYLYATSVVSGYTGFRLLRINSTSGQANDLMQINATDTEGLAIDRDGTVYISYSTVPSTVVSDQLAIVDTVNHTITNVGSPAFDMDGLCFDPVSNILYGTDASGSKGAVVYEFSSYYPSVTYHKLGRIPAPNNGVSYLAVVGDGTAYGFETDRDALIHFRLQPLEVLSIALVGDIGAIAIPEPSTALLLVLGCLGAIQRRRRYSVLDCHHRR